MQSSRKLLLSWLLACCAVLTAVSVSGNGDAVTLPVADLAAWRAKSFKGETNYSVTRDEGKSVVRAESSGAASGYYRKLVISGREYPNISWSWKINSTVAAENPYRKSGDDFAARVYVIFPGRFFWQTRAVVYVWSDKLPPGTVIASPYSERVAIIAVESGNSRAGSWQQEKRNYIADYRAYFHHDPDDPVAVAFMTDTDNTGSHAVAWYGDIVFSR